MTPMNRRSFAHKLALSVVAVALMSLTGCTWGSAISQLEAWIPIALTALSAIVKLLGPVIPAPVAVTIALINAGFSALLTALKNYQAGSSTLADISNAVAAVESAFASFFASLNVPSALLTTIEGLAEILLSTLMAYANEIVPASVTTGRVYRLAGKPITVVPMKRSVSQFKAAWNAEALKDKHPEAAI